MTIKTEIPGKYANVNGLQMYYEIHGTGNPLVLIHGGGSSIYTTFGRVLENFAKSRKVIAVDLQAHGRTADNGRITTFEQDADDVAELLQQLEIKDADVFGFSNGANTTMQLAIRHPRLIRKIVVASGFYKRAGMFKGFWEMMDKGTIADMPQELKDDYVKIAPRPQDLHIMHERDAKRMINFKDWEEDMVRSIKAPAFVIGAENDVMVPEHTVEMYRLFNNGSLAIFPGGHGDYLGEINTTGTYGPMPAIVVTMVNEFLDKPMPDNK